MSYLDPYKRQAAKSSSSAVTTQRVIAVFLMLSGAFLFLARAWLAQFLPDTLTMRLFLFVGATLLLLLMIADLVVSRLKLKKRHTD